MAIRLRHADEDFGPVHEINVTPFIDVMLVLLVIFMVTAPLATVSVPVTLPAAQAEPTPQLDRPIVLTLAADHTLSLGDRPVNGDALGPLLDGESGGHREKPVFLRADHRVDYGALMGVMDRLRAAGYLKVALVGLPQDAAAGSSSTP